MPEFLPTWFRDHTEFLYSTIYQKWFFYIDFWSLVHLWSGFVIFMMLLALQTKKIWFWFIFIIIAYELIEVLFVFFAFHIFKPEKLNDQLLDIFVGLIAGYLCKRLLSSKLNESGSHLISGWQLMLFSSMTFSFVWVGNYQYAYNAALLNTKNFNLFAFSVWLAGGFILLQVYHKVKLTFSSGAKRFIIMAILYLTSVLLIDNTGRHLLGIEELNANGEKMNSRGIIHGHLAQYIYYLLFPWLIIIFHETLVKQAQKALNQLWLLKNGVKS
jgi:hypothetical protein